MSRDGVRGNGGASISNKATRHRPRKGNVVYNNFGARDSNASDIPVAGKRSDQRLGVLGQIISDWVRTGCDSSRISRGMSYLRSGNVLSVECSRMRVVAEVKGSQLTPFEVGMRLNPAWEEERAELVDTWAKLIEPGLSPSVEEIPYPVAMKLAGRTPYMQCNCPDSAAICKHMVAVGEALARRVDADPKTMFTLRDLDAENVIAEVYDKVGAVGQDDPSRFWEGTEFPPLPELSKRNPLNDGNPEHLWHACRMGLMDDDDAKDTITELSNVYDLLLQSEES